MRARQIILSMVALLIAGCAAGEPPQSGFLSTYDNLQPITPTLRRYVSPSNELGHYSKFIIDPVETRFNKSADVDPKDAEHLKQYMYLAIRAELGAKYTLVSDPQPGAARIRVALTSLTAANPAMHQARQTRVAGIALGQASVEAEIVDSETGKQLAAVIDSESGSAFSSRRNEEWGAVEDVMTEWAKRLAKRIDELHVPAK